MFHLIITLHVNSALQCFSMLLNYCIHTEESYKSLDTTTLPEVQRSSMAPVVLQLKALGIDNVLRFDYLSVSN